MVPAFHEITPSTIGASPSGHTHNTLLALGRLDTANNSYSDSNFRWYLSSGTMKEGKPPTDGTILHFPWDSGKWDTQIFQSDTLNGQLAVRSNNNGTWGTWNKVYDTGHKPSASDVGAAEASHTHTSDDVLNLDDTIDRAVSSLNAITTSNREVVVSSTQHTNSNCQL